MKKTLLVLAVLLTASCGLSDDSSTKEVNAAEEGNDGARAWVSADQRHIELMAPGGACDQSAEIRVSETAPRVRVALRVTTKKGNCIALLVSRSFRVDLKKPLGHRALVGANGAAYPRLNAPPWPGKPKSEIPTKVIHDVFM
ncbi:hypothetical protein [Actinomadura rudentiformis]|uniref:Lipoprotein n=1 Tax=Actinomadura rudentiformis TaxID=359158 RepID=A0A6H9YMG4_9ACTN|nr:hypothetical protein [Actinomadura rudentiformis]KAB2344479.1 hypothetical protein F8566_31635 [Actinomadura rudentiformis]